MKCPVCNNEMEEEILFSSVEYKCTNCPTILDLDLSSVKLINAYKDAYNELNIFEEEEGEEK